MWAQDPEPTTGRLPVQVLIDGRAQGAYPIETFRQYVAASGTAGRPGRP